MNQMVNNIWLTQNLTYVKNIENMQSAIRLSKCIAM